MKNFMSEAVITDKVKKQYYSIVDPLINLFIRLNAHPNIFTMIGLVLSIIASVFAGMGIFRIAGLFLLISGMCDSIDGTIARRSGQTTKFGALLDSTLDRYSEMFVFFGLAFYFMKDHAYLTSMALAIGLGGSLMVSYIRARAEGLGFKCSIGLMQRAERIILLAFGAITTETVLIMSIWIIAILSNVTAIQRVAFIWKIDRGKQDKDNVVFK
ncbi:CDP-alcohol phosphatidyltransferase family protein [bacterium]|nr:CDP-alcohol phosphatidyltransferase family protein [bacterium]